jgi:hypothetical protein
VDRQNSATFGDDASTNDRSGNLRDRVFGTRDPDRAPRDRNDRNNPLGRRNTREGDGDGWTPVARARRGSQADEGDRWQRLGDRKDKEVDPAEEQTRRNGVGRGRFERSSWQRDNEQAVEGDAPKTGARNWRERDRERERDRDRGDRDWTRGNRMPDRVEEDPEWMDTPAPKEGKKQAHTQEDFERWKETMKASNRASEEREEPPAPAKESAKPTAIKLELADSIFTTWGAGVKPEPKKQPDEPLPGIGATQIGASAKQAKAAKSSRFVGLFQKEETPPAEIEAPPASIPIAQTPNGSAKKTEDEEGFARILQMLGGTKIGGTPQQQQPSMAQNRQMMNDLDFERKQDHTPVSSRPESARLIQDLMARVEGNKSRGPQTAPLESEATQQYFPSPGADYGRGHNGRNENITPRTGGMFSPPLPHDMNMGPRRVPDGDSRDILLSMIQQGRQQHEPEQFNFTGLRKQQMNMQHEGMQRAAPSAPPGLHDGPFPRREQESDMQSLRKTTSRPQQPPPGFFDFPDDPAIMSGGHPGLPRRNTADQQQPGRLPMSNMGIPSQQAPADPFRGMNMPPLNAPERNMGPPPGFGIRPPPGFQQGPPPQMPPHGHPGLRDPRGPQGMFGGPGMPPGGMPPPGYPGFNGPPPPQQGIPNGPPPGFGGPRDHREFLMMQQAQALGRMPDEMMGRGRGGMPPGYM